MKKYILTTIFLGSMLAAFAGTVEAAKFYTGYQTSSFNIGQDFELMVKVDTENELVNTVSSVIYYEPESLELVDIDDGDSIVNFWIEKNSEPGRITLSGLIPGGHNGSRSEVLRLMFRTVRSGQGQISVTENKVFLNDGFGTVRSVGDTTFEYNVSSSFYDGVAIQKIVDTDPPESFDPQVAESPLLFDNKWFVVFDAKDKGSGMSHFLVKESRYRALMFFQSWKEAESPYVLKDQDRKSLLVIKALDKSGNSTTEIVYPKVPPSLFARIVVSVSLVITAVAAAMLVFYLFYKTRLVFKNDNDLKNPD